MELAVNSQNEDLKRTFNDGGAYMRFSRGQAQVFLLLFLCGFAFSCGHQMFLPVSRVPKD